MKLFVPLEDATQSQLREDDRLVPYQTGMFLFSQVEILTPSEATASNGLGEISPGPVPANHPVEPPIRRLYRR